MEKKVTTQVFSSIFILFICCMEKPKEWWLEITNSQIADTGDYDGSVIITNGSTELITHDDAEDEEFNAIVDALNKSGCNFYCGAENYVSAAEASSKYLSGINSTLITVLKEVEKHHQGYHSEIGWKIRNAIYEATGEQVGYEGDDNYNG